ncbi:hypothetical protein [Chlamydia felis Fe/C-56]|uniref:Uncharacterized protein n=1 Tax=Chlamydia felis (strain Fe/C-56) TaxID=264202 RepID=Q255S8_CHLFF|nr:hypothetical protein [Chlamydia felis Fe/C-56]
MRFCCFILLLLTSLPAWGRDLILIGREETTSDKFSPPQHTELANGQRVYYSYYAALMDAQENSRGCIFVYFNPRHKQVWTEVTQKDFCLPRDLGNVCNIVVMQPGLISSKDFYPKIDPMVLYMADFQDRFWELDLQGPCVILITVDANGRDKVHRVLPCSSSVS